MPLTGWIGKAVAEPLTAPGDMLDGGQANAGGVYQATEAGHVLFKDRHSPRFVGCCSFGFANHALYRLWKSSLQLSHR